MDTILSQYGLAGLVIASLSGVVIYLYRKVESLYVEKNDLQDQRRQDVIDARDKYNEAMGNFSRTTELLLAKLDGRKEG